MAPSGLREYLIEMTRSKAEMSTLLYDAPTVDSTADESDGRELEEGECSAIGSLPTMIHVRPPQQIEEDTPINFSEDKANRDKPFGKNARDRNKTNETQQKPPSPPPLQVEKILQRTAITSAICFLLHLSKSPSTRKSWRSTLNFFASCGLFSTAVSTGLASKVVGSTYTNENSIIRLVCDNALKRLPLFQDANAKICEMLNRLKEEVKNNRRLQMAFAFSVIYGFRRAGFAHERRTGRWGL